MRDGGWVSKQHRIYYPASAIPIIWKYHRTVWWTEKLIQFTHSRIYWPSIVTSSYHNSLPYPPISLSPLYFSRIPSSQTSFPFIWHDHIWRKCHPALVKGGSVIQPPAGIHFSIYMWYCLKLLHKCIRPVIAYRHRHECHHQQKAPFLPRVDSYCYREMC
jgi:hypothetical protein